MSTIAVANGNVIGVTVQQSDLPMVQFFLNGQATAPEQSINRFRGVVYPAVYLSDEEHDDNGTDGHLSLRFVFHETDFRHAPPSSRFCPVMVARGLV